jgi:hypothetical protein
MNAMQVKRAKPKYVNALLVGFGIEILLVAMKGGALVDYLWVVGGSAVCLSLLALVVRQQRGNLSVPSWSWPCMWAWSNVAAALFGFILIYNRVSDQDHIHAREIPYTVFTAVSIWFNLLAAGAKPAPESSVA